jgi:hypothetical protein
VINAGSGSGIPRLAPENSAALWREEFKSSWFHFMNFKAALKWTRSVCLRAF